MIIIIIVIAAIACILDALMIIGHVRTIANLVGKIPAQALYSLSIITTCLIIKLLFISGAIEVLK